MYISLIDLEGEQNEEEKIIEKYLNEGKHLCFHLHLFD